MQETQPQFSQRLRNYETLLRHHENGSVSAHHQTISEVMRDGVVIAATVSAPVPLSSVADELEPIIGAAVIAAVADADRLRHACEEKDAQLANLGRELTELRKLLEAAEKQ